MKRRSAEILVAGMSGAYDTGRTLVVTGRDQFGNPITEALPDFDFARAERDVDAGLWTLPTYIRISTKGVKL
jgi:hypothetical protein